MFVLVIKMINAGTSLSSDNKFDLNFKELKSLKTFRIVTEENEIKDNWIGGDKARHFLGSLFSTVFITKINQQKFSYSKSDAKIIGAGLTFSLGIFKEVYDSHSPNNRFSWKDLLADSFGITAGLILLGIK